MKLIRTNDSDGKKSSAWPEALNPLLGRRKFLAAAGLGGLGAGLAALAGPSMVKEVEAQGKGQPQPPKLEQHKTVCTNCAVGCGFIGESQNGVWVSQEPWFEHPINQGSLCSKGAAAREKVVNEKRLRYPMKLAGGKWQRLSWDQALSEISTKLLELRKQHGPDMLQVNFSAHQSNENGYAIRKWAAMWGTNNADFQARI
jgi:formate dehydrogenase major subunit